MERVPLLSQDPTAEVVEIIKEAQEEKENR